MQCGIQEDWYKLSQGKSALQGLVEMCIDSINKEVEKSKDQNTDERKRNQLTHLATASAGFVCDHQTAPSQPSIKLA